MFKDVLLNGYLFWGMALLGGLGLLSKVLSVTAYQRLVKQSENMNAGKGKMLQQLKTRFENCFKANLCVNNISVFVTKHLNRYKFLGMTVANLNRFTYKMLLLTGIISLGGCAAGLYFSMSVDWMLYCLLTGGMVSLLMLLADSLSGNDLRKERIFANITDYYENTMVNRLAQEYAKQEQDMTAESNSDDSTEWMEESAPEQERTASHLDKEKMRRAAELLEEIAAEQERKELYGKDDKIIKNKKDSRQEIDDNEVLREILSEFLA